MFESEASRTAAIEIARETHKENVLEQALKLSDVTDLSLNQCAELLKFIVDSRKD